MGKQSKSEALSEENIAATTIITTEDPKNTETEVPKKIDLQNYLDSLSLTRAERMYYERTYGSIQILKTYGEWKNEIKIVH